MSELDKGFLAYAELGPDLAEATPEPLKPADVNGVAAVNVVEQDGEGVVKLVEPQSGLFDESAAVGRHQCFGAEHPDDADVRVTAGHHAEHAFGRVGRGDGQTLFGDA